MKDRVEREGGKGIRLQSPQRIIAVQRDLCLALAKAESLEESLNACLDAATAATGLDVSGIYLADPHSGDLRLAQSRGLSQIMVGKVAYEPADSDRARIVREGRPVYLEAGGPLARWGEENLAAEAIRSVAVVPIAIRGRVVGCLNMASRQRERIPRLLRSVLEIVAGQIGLSLARFQAQEALRESENQFRSLVEQSVAGVYMIQDGCYRYVNAQFAQTLGYTVAEMTGMRAGQVIHPDDLPVVRENVRRRLDKEINSLRYQFRMVTKGGETRYAEVLGARSLFKGKPAIIGTLIDITEHKQTQQSLQASEASYRTLFEHIHNGIVLQEAVRDQEGQVCGIRSLDVNPAFERQTGQKAAEVLGRNLIDTFPDCRMWEEVLADYRQVLDQGEIRQVERFLPHLGRRLSVTLVPAGGDRVIAVVEDATDRRRAEEALRESEEKFRTLFESSNDAILILDERIIIDCNRRSLEMFGCQTREELIGKTLLDFSPLRQPSGRDSAPEALRHYQKAMAGRTQTFQWQQHRLDGTPFLAEVSLHVFELRGRMLEQVIVRDVTEKQRIHEAMVRLSTAIEQAAEEVLIMDPSLVIQYVNPAFEQVTGYSRTEVLGRNAAFLWDGIPDEVFSRNLVETIQHGEIWKGRIKSRCKDGRLVQEEATITPILSSRGEITGYIDLKRDITDAVRLEDQLRQAQKMEAIGTLAGGIAHDFNNILSAILGYTEIALAMIDVKAPIRSHLDQVFRAGERARDLVKQILAFSRQGEVARRPLRVSLIVKEVLTFLRASLPTTVQIRTEIRAVRDTVLGDPTHFHQILMNLCTNAAQAMPERKGTLTVALEDTEIADGEAEAPPGLPTGSYLRLLVADTGAGIDSLIMDRIFEPFFTTKKPGDGTGMGLAAVYGIVTGYGGKILVKSRVGLGTEVAVYLPLLKEAEAPRQPGSAGPIPGGRECILFVDDEPALVDLGKELLAPLGYEVLAHQSATEALAFFSDRPGRYDLLITDMTMPGLTGLELAQECLRIRPDLPVILCTGFSETVTSEHIRSAGIRELIYKPVIQRRLAETIRRVLDENP